MNRAGESVRLERASTLFLVRHLSFLIYDELELGFKAFQLPVGQYMALNTLHRRRRSSAALSRALSITPQTVIRQISALENKGLICRRKDKADNRALIVELTARGRSTLAKCDGIVRKLEARLLKPLDKTLQKNLRDALILMSRA